MVFKLNEAACGIKHAYLGWERAIRRHKRDRFLPRFSQLSIPAAPARDFDGSPLYCHICGYARVCLILPDGWTLELCSSLPPLSVEQEPLRQWLNAVPRSRLDLPTTCV